MAVSSGPAVDAWAIELVASLETEVIAANFDWTVREGFKTVESGRRILECAPSDQAELVAATLLRFKQVQETGRVDGQNFWARYRLLTDVTAHLLRQRLPHSEERLAGLIAYCAESLIHSYEQHLVLPLLKEVERVAVEGAAHDSLAAAVNLLSEQAMNSHQVRSPVRAAIARLVERLTGNGEQSAGLAASPWRNRVLADIATLGEEVVATSRSALEQAASAVGKSKPSQAFLKDARTLLAKDRSLPARMIGWIEAHAPEAGRPDPNDDVIRGLMWMLATADGEGVAPRIGQYCELCFKKVPNIGAPSVKLGNGAIQALGLLGGTHAVAELTRLKSRVRYPLVVKKIETTLSELAGQLGVSEGELEEMALPTFGLSPDGERRLPVADGMAVIRIKGTRDVDLSWARPDGKEFASIPKAFKETASEAVATARRLKKEIEGALAGQSARLERLYFSERRMPFDQWRERYLEHPLVADLTRRLIWRFECDGGPVAGLARNGAIEDVTGRPIAPSPDLTVTLWHPLHAAASHVLDWRKRLAEVGISQPFKQAHREVYVVTDAERHTDIYSNRFAAHVLRQHQFKALCDQRGWRFHLMGAWDSHNTPTRTLSGQRLSVEFWVNMVENAQTTEAFVYELIATDQVRFVGPDNQPLPVSQVPQLVFSELMRDVDLFVGVASVGNDPNWVDGGPDGRFRDYWGGYAFGDLSETAKTRAAVLATLVPQLVIADRCTLEDRFLVVRGKLRTYRIHLGSANIQMEPNNQYLCIVQGRGRTEHSKPVGRLVLPFEGDNTLSIILSKAFLLADDDKIADPTITRQIKHL